MVGEGSRGYDFTSYVIICNGLCGVVKVGNYVKEPTLGVEMGSCEGMMVELCIDIVFDRLGDDAAIVVDDILESCDWRLWDTWWLVGEIGGVLRDPRADVICVGVEEGKESVWGDRDLFEASVSHPFGFGFALFCKLMRLDMDKEEIVILKCFCGFGPFWDLA